MPNYVTEKSELAENIKNIRESFGLTQDEISKILNLDRSTFAYYETGRTKPDIFTLMKLAEYLQIPFEFFYTKDGGSKQLKKMHKLIMEERNEKIQWNLF